MPRPPLRLHPAFSGELSSDELIPPDELSPEEDETSAFVAEVNARLSLGKLPQVMCSSPTRAPSSEEETPVDGPGAVENWLGLVDHAQTLQAQALGSTPLHPVLKRQARRALRSVLLYEHQITPRTRRQARQALWRRQHTGPLPALEVLLKWEQCRCLPCQHARAMTPNTETVPTLVAAVEQSA